MKTLIKILLLLCGSACGVSAQHYAYFYFEGDQETPFYVKVEGQMQERFGQNHFIIPRLDAGYTHFEILFEQNAYPPQKFLLEVPEGGSRGFVLHKVNERQFALYDLQQHRYIVAGNTKEQDHAPDGGSGRYIQNLASKSTASDAGGGQLPEFSPEATNKPADSPVAAGTTSSTASGPDFLSNIELNTEGTAGKAPAGQHSGLSREEQRIARKVKRARDRANGGDDLTLLPALRYDSSGLTLTATPDEDSQEEPEEATINIPNTDCPNAMDNDAFENFALKFIEQADDNKKLRLLRKHHRDLCFSTEQVRIITKNLETQSARYSAVKMLYAQTTDQENYHQLERLFNTPFLKAKFNEIIEH